MPLITANTAIYISTPKLNLEAGNNIKVGAICIRQLEAVYDLLNYTKHIYMYS